MAVHTRCAISHKSQQQNPGYSDVTHTARFQAYALVKDWPRSQHACSYSVPRPVRNMQNTDLNGKSLKRPNNSFIHQHTDADTSALTTFP
jgi:hypothetical protein